jgi:hypothetical protein
MCECMEGDVPTIEQYTSRFPWLSPEQQRQQNLLDQAGDIIQEAVDYLKRQCAIPFDVVHVNTGIEGERMRECMRDMTSVYNLPFQAVSISYLCQLVYSPSVHIIRDGIL